MALSNPISEDKAWKRALAAGKRYFPAAKLAVSRARLLSEESYWEFLIETEGDPPSRKRIFIDAFTGAFLRAGSFISLALGEETVLGEGDIARPGSGAWAIELISRKGRPIIVRTDDSGATQAFPITMECQTLRLGNIDVCVKWVRRKGEPQTTVPSDPAAGEGPFRDARRAEAGSWLVGFVAGPSQKAGI